MQNLILGQMIVLTMLLYWMLLLHAVPLSEVSCKLIDLSHKHGPNTFMALGQPPYSRYNVKTRELSAGGWVETGVYSSAEHGGTHMDAPSHFLKGGMSLDDIPLEKTIAEGVLIDVAKEVNNKNEYQVPLSKVLEWEKTHGDIPNEAAVIFNFGWHTRFHSKRLYVNTETDDWSLVRSPSVSKEVGDYLYDKRNIKIIGTDTVSPDPFFEMPIHIKYLRNNRLIIENLNATDQLPPRGFRFQATPVKYVGASGAQVRAFAFVYENADSASVKLTWAWPVVTVWLIISFLLYQE